MFRMEYWHTAFSMIYCILFLPAIFNIYCNLNSVTHTHTHAFWSNKCSRGKHKQLFQVEFTVYVFTNIHKNY